VCGSCIFSDSITIFHRCGEPEASAKFDPAGASPVAFRITDRRRKKKPKSEGKLRMNAEVSKPLTEKKKHEKKSSLARFSNTHTICALMKF
jgi:hypothetical protein